MVPNLIVGNVSNGLYRGAWGCFGGVSFEASAAIAKNLPRLPRAEPLSSVQKENNGHYPLLVLTSYVLYLVDAKVVGYSLGYSLGCCGAHLGSSARVSPIGTKEAIQGIQLWNPGWSFALRQPSGVLSGALRGH